MLKWMRQLGRLASGCVVLASLSPGCDDETPDVGKAASGNCNAEPDLTPELLPNAQLDADVIARAAVVLGSCWPDDRVPGNAAQLWSANIGARRNYYLNVMQARCLADAGCGCDAMERCLGYALQTGLASGCQSRCDGDVFRGCGEELDLPDGYGLNIDCGMIGQRCDVSGVCVDDGAVSCDDGRPVCGAGARPTYCEDGALREGPDCAALGLSCANGQCVGTGQDCATRDFTRAEIVAFEGISCQAGTLEACVAGRRATLSCAEQGPGFDCQSVDGLAFCGLASECLPADVAGGEDLPYPRATCDGTRLTFCNAGRLETLDCTRLGFSGCEVNGGVGHYGCTPSLSFFENTD